MVHRVRIYCPRVYIPKQNLNSGTAIIKIVEGYVESIRFENDAEQPRLELRSTFPGMLNKPFNFRDLEQGMEQLDRLQSNGATVRLLPGKDVRATVVVFDNASLVLKRG
ncbi:MAG: POTRA domain-containing protein [Amphritea sp.]